MIWRPRSILQLVLLGLVAVVAPLCVGIFYTLQTLGALAQESALLSEAVVSVTRVTQVLQSDLLDLERRARQYLTLEDESLLALFRDERARLLSQVEDMARVRSLSEVPDPALERAREAVASALRALPGEGDDLAGQMGAFGDLFRANERFQQLSQAYVDRRLAGYRAHADDIRRSLLWLVSALALLTVFLSLVFIYWVSRPIRQLEAEIRQLGQSGPGRAISISGPREMQALAGQLEWLRGRLNEVDSRKQQFLMHMSHELKTPLASLREGVELLADGVAGQLAPRQREITEILQENSRELQRLIENLLDYNRAAHRNDLQSEVVELQGLCQDLLQMHSISARRKRLDISLDVPTGALTTDPAKLRTVIDNLLSNAVHYAPPAGRVLLRCRRDGPSLMLEVANTGEVIPASEQGQIFQPFYQGSASRSGPIKGSGIGLSVARECARDLGGTLELVDCKGFAACFRMVLPRVGQVAA